MKTLWSRNGKKNNWSHTHTFLYSSIKYNCCHFHFFVVASFRLSVFEREDLNWATTTKKLKEKNKWNEQKEPALVIEQVYENEFEVILFCWLLYSCERALNWLNWVFFLNFLLLVSLFRWTTFMCELKRYHNSVTIIRFVLFNSTFFLQFDFFFVIEIRYD